MTRPQQESSRELDAALAKFLISYGWRPTGKRWSHPRFHEGKILCTDLDAWLQTRATPQLGWP